MRRAIHAIDARRRDAHQHRQRQSQPAGPFAVGGRQLARHDRDENHVVDAEDDLEQRQRDERNPCFRRGQPFHRCGRIVHVDDGGRPAAVESRPCARSPSPSTISAACSPCRRWPDSATARRTIDDGAEPPSRAPHRQRRDHAAVVGRKRVSLPHHAGGVRDAPGVDDGPARPRVGDSEHRAVVRARDGPGTAPSRARVSDGDAPALQRSARRRRASSAACRELAASAGIPLILYLKEEDGFGRDRPAGLDAIARLVDDGLVVAIKYAVVRQDPGVDAYLDGLLARVDRARVVSGMGERPAVQHLRQFGLPGFTTGSGCVAPGLSQALFDACRTGDWSSADACRAPFLPLEDIRDAWGPRACFTPRSLLPRSPTPARFRRSSAN